MKTSAAVRVLLVVAVLSACTEPPRQKSDGPSKPPPPTATELLSSLQAERAAGRPGAALKLARQLISSHSDTPEAAAAAKQVTELEAAVAAAEAAERVRVVAAAAAAETQRLADKWHYSVSEDPMTSRKARYATIKSENTVNFGFPYEGPQRGELTLRDHPSYGKNALFSIDEGQILCTSYDDCHVRIRFDEGVAERWRAIGPSDNSTTVIFLRNEARFLQKLRSAKVIRLQIPIYQQGEPMFEFHVGGFSNARYQQ